MYSWTTAHFNRQTCWIDILTMIFIFRMRIPKPVGCWLKKVISLPYFHSFHLTLFSSTFLKWILTHLVRNDSKSDVFYRYLNNSMNSFTFPLLCTLSVVALQDAVQWLCSVQFCYTLFWASNNCIFACWRVIHLSLLRCQTKGYNCLPLYVIKMVSSCRSQLYVITSSVKRILYPLIASLSVKSLSEIVCWPF